MLLRRCNSWPPDLARIRPGGGRIYPLRIRWDRHIQHIRHAHGLHRGRGGRRPQGQEDIRDPRQREGEGGHRFRTGPGPRIRGTHVRGDRRRHGEVRRGRGPDSDMPVVQRLLWQGDPGGQDAGERRGHSHGDRQRDALRARHDKGGRGPLRPPREAGRGPRRRLERPPKLLGKDIISCEKDGGQDSGASSDRHPS